MAMHHRRRGGDPLPPPDQSDHRGKKRNLHREHLVGLFLVHKFLGPRLPPPLLIPPPSIRVRAQFIPSQPFLAFNGPPTDFVTARPQRTRRAQGALRRGSFEGAFPATSAQPKRGMWWPPGRGPDAAGPHGGAETLGAGSHPVADGTGVSSGAVRGGISRRVRVFPQVCRQPPLTPSVRRVHTRRRSWDGLPTAWVIAKAIVAANS